LRAIEERKNANTPIVVGVVLLALVVLTFAIVISFSTAAANPGARRSASRFPAVSQPPKPRVFSRKIFRSTSIVSCVRHFRQTVVAALSPSCQRRAKI